MKAEIHPEYKESTVHCVCGNTYTTRSTVESIQVDICSACHPFFTGKQKLVDTAGRVERFRRRYAKTEAKKGSAGADSGENAAASEKAPAADLPTSSASKKTSETSES